MENNYFSDAYMSLQKMKEQIIPTETTDNKSGEGFWLAFLDVEEPSLARLIDNKVNRVRLKSSKKFPVFVAYADGRVLRTYTVEEATQLEQDGRIMFPGKYDKQRFDDEKKRLLNKQQNIKDGAIKAAKVSALAIGTVIVAGGIIYTVLTFGNKDNE